MHRWSKVLRPGLKKGSWTAEEDAMLIEWVKSEGEGKWALCAVQMKGRRSGKQCRERWNNTLDPDVKKGEWTRSEDVKLFEEYWRMGSKWASMANNFDGRTENSIKNRFYSLLRKMASVSVREGSQKNKTKEELMQYFDQTYESVKRGEKINPKRGRKRQGSIGSGSGSGAQEDCVSSHISSHTSSSSSPIIGSAISTSASTGTSDLTDYPDYPTPNLLPAKRHLFTDFHDLQNVLRPSPIRPKLSLAIQILPNGIQPIPAGILPTFSQLPPPSLTPQIPQMPLNYSHIPPCTGTYNYSGSTQQLIDLRQLLHSITTTNLQGTSACKLDTAKAILDNLLEQPTG